MFKSKAAKTTNTDAHNQHRSDLTELVFILDRSGSMHGLEEDTIGGFNSMIEKQKKEEGKAINFTEYKIPEKKKKKEKEWELLE